MNVKAILEAEAVWSWGNGSEAFKWKWGFNLGPFPERGARGVTPPDNCFASKLPNLPFLSANVFTFLHFLEHKKKNYALRRNGKLVNLIHLFIRPSHINRYSSIIGTTPISSTKWSYNPQGKFLGTALATSIKV